jgi:pathogenesis-related genes transcriptional activator PTI6
VVNDFRQKGEQPSKSGYRGVYLNKKTGQWVARTVDQRVRVRLGGFDDIEDAARCYDQEAVRLRGADAVTNFPQIVLVDRSGSS